jgi:hypothetical protein
VRRTIAALPAEQNGSTPLPRFQPVRRHADRGGVIAAQNQIDQDDAENRPQKMHEGRSLAKRCLPPAAKSGTSK